MFAMVECVQGVDDTYNLTVLFPTPDVAGETYSLILILLHTQFDVCDNMYGLTLFFSTLSLTCVITCIV